MAEIVIPYTPNPVQRQIHDLAQRIRFLVVAAHRGAGKSLAAVNEALTHPVQGVSRPWKLVPWTCPRCATVTPSTPEINTPCRVCGYREWD